MEKKVFILYGAANKGKSTTFNMLFNQICRKFSENLVFFRRFGNGLDFVAVFDNGEKRIGLYSAGDGEEEVSRNLYELYEQGCDFVLGTSRTRGGSCAAINRYAMLLEGSEEIIEWYEKIEASDADNERAGKELFSVFKTLIAQ